MLPNDKPNPNAHQPPESAAKPLPNPDIYRVPAIPDDWVRKYDEMLLEKRQREREDWQAEQERQRELEKEKQEEATVGFKIWLEKKDRIRQQKIEQRR